MEEIWRDIKGYEGLYQVSNLGRVKSLERVVIRNDGSRLPIKESLKIPQKGNGRYYTVMLYKDNTYIRHRIHRLVAEAFIPNPEEKPFVDHIDTDTHNNIVTNLRWVTVSENHLNPLTVAKRLKKLGDRFARDVAAEYGLSMKQVSNRLKHGWDLERACTTPIKRRQNVSSRY